MLCVPFNLVSLFLFGLDGCLSSILSLIYGWNVLFSVSFFLFMFIVSLVLFQILVKVFVFGLWSCSYYSFFLSFFPIFSLFFHVFVLLSLSLFFLSLLFLHYFLYISLSVYLSTYHLAILSFFLFPTPYSAGHAHYRWRGSPSLASVTRVRRRRAPASL